MTEPSPELRRSLTLPLIIFYGLGTIIGAGIYVLIGKIADRAGLFAPVAFLIAALIATLTAFSYGELSSRHPRSAGEVAYVDAAFSWRILSRLMGFAVVMIGVVSAATMARGFVGYLQEFVDIPPWAIMTILILTLGTIAAWGISQSVWVATIATLLEIGGLFFVLWIVGDAFSELPTRWESLIPPLELTPWLGIFTGAFLAFYAFIGFEDMVNVAEEVKNVRYTLPLAILLVLIGSTVLYLLISLVAVLTLPLDQLRISNAPMADILRTRNVNAARSISLISMVAVLNGALIQIIMASRVLYGMARQGMILPVLGRVNTTTQTPLVATAIVTGIVIVFSLWLPLITLAEITSYITLTIFCIMHLSLWRLKLIEVKPDNAVSYPIIIPIMGFFITGSVIVFQAWLSLLT